jgi:hypothetical protein
MLGIFFKIGSGRLSVLSSRQIIDFSKRVWPNSLSADIRLLANRWAAIKPAPDRAKSGEIRINDLFDIGTLDFYHHIDLLPSQILISA